jgi:hypothetical protein
MQREKKTATLPRVHKRTAQPNRAHGDQSSLAAHQTKKQPWTDATVSGAKSEQGQNPAIAGTRKSALADPSDSEDMETQALRAAPETKLKSNHRANSPAKTPVRKKPVEGRDANEPTARGDQTPAPKKPPTGKSPVMKLVQHCYNFLILVCPPSIFPMAGSMYLKVVCSIDSWKRRYLRNRRIMKTRRMAQMMQVGVPWEHWAV